MVGAKRIRGAIALALLAALGGASGCGNSDDTTTVTQTESDLKGSKVAPKLKLEAKVAGSKQFGSSIDVKGHDSVAIEATVNNAEDMPVVRVTIDKGPATELKVTAGGTEGKSTATATLTSADELKVVDLKWNCSLPPKTFCPVNGSESDSGFKLQAVPVKNIPIRFSVQLRAAQ